MAMLVKCGDRIKSRLIQLGMTQAELSRRSGINKVTLSQYISHKYLPAQDKLYLLGKILNVNPAWLMGFDISSTPTITALDTQIQEIMAQLLCLPEEDLHKVMDYIDLLKLRAK